MTFEIAKDAPERARTEVEKLHELAVNDFGYGTEHVLFTAHGDGTISGRIAFYVASDYHHYDGNEDDQKPESILNSRKTDAGNDDRDPDPPAVGARVSLPDATGEKTEASV